MEITLKLLESQHKLLWGRRKAIQAKFKVEIDSPFACSEYSEPQNWMYNGFSASGYVIISVKGENAGDLEAVEKYVTEVFKKPEIIEIFSYHEDLEPVFGNIVWIQIFEELYNVCISKSAQYELNIAGTDSSVQSAVSSMEELLVKCRECKDTLNIDDEKPLAQKLVSALRACEKEEVSVSTYHTIPNDVITLLLSLLEKACGENFPKDDLSPLDDSVLILDAPERKAEYSVIILDSDSDYSSDHKLLNSCKNISRSKKRKKLCKEKSDSKKKNLLLCDLGHQSDCDLQKPMSHPNPPLQNPKVDCTIDKSKLPIIENAEFISLSLGGKSNSSSSNTPVQETNSHAAEKEVEPKEAEAEVVVVAVPQAPRRLRPVVIDGCNIAFHCTQGRREDFSWKRIEKSIQLFLGRGHTDVKAFIPQYRRPLCYEKAGSQTHVEKLENQQLIVFTPSRKIEGRTISCYDDRFVVDYAFRTGGVILSNDNYRDLMAENVEWSKTIKERLLMYVFAGDELMIPEDPLGSKGPRLNDFLAFP